MRLVTISVRWACARVWMRTTPRPGRPWRASTAAVSKPAAEPPTTAIFWLFARGVGWETLRASRDSSAIVCFCNLPYELRISDLFQTSGLLQPARLTPHRDQNYISADEPLQSERRAKR